MDHVELSAEVIKAIAGSHRWTDLQDKLNRLAKEVHPESRPGGLSGWQPTRASSSIDWLPSAIAPDVKLMLMDRSTAALRKALTTEAGIRSVLRIAIRASRLAGA